MKVVFAGKAGFPYFKGAAYDRIGLLCQSMENAGIKTTVLARKGIMPYGTVYPSRGTFEGVEYLYVNGTASRKNNYFIWLINRAIGLIKENIYIIDKARKGELDALFIYTQYSLNVIMYKILSKLFNFPIILNLVEYRSSFNTKNKFSRIDYRVFDNLVYRFADGYIPISDFLVEKIKNFSTSYIKIPAITNPDRLKSVEKHVDKEKYFLYCGFAAYIEIIHFIILSFEKIVNQEYGLYIITIGSPERISRIKKLIETSSKASKITLFVNIDYEDLLKLYKSSKANLIPLRNETKDIARFPHKIAEYTASGNPIITTNVGEIINYFMDNDNALIANKYDEIEYSEKMKFVIEQPEKAKDIGERGRLLCNKYFNYKSYSLPLKELIVKLKNHEKVG